MKTKKPDNRPRFGYCHDLDSQPQICWETKIAGGTPIVVIPVPFNSTKVRQKVRNFTKEFLWPKD